MYAACRMQCILLFAQSPALRLSVVSSHVFVLFSAFRFAAFRLNQSRWKMINFFACATMHHKHKVSKFRNENSCGAGSHRLGQVVAVPVSASSVSLATVSIIFKSLRQRRDELNHFIWCEKLFAAWMRTRAPSGDATLPIYMKSSTSSFGRSVGGVSSFMFNFIVLPSSACTYLLFTGQQALNAVLPQQRQVAATNK